MVVQLVKQLYCCGIVYNTADVVVFTNCNPTPCEFDKHTAALQFEVHLGLHRIALHLFKHRFCLEVKEVHDLSVQPSCLLHHILCHKDRLFTKRCIYTHVSLPTFSRVSHIFYNVGKTYCTAEQLIKYN